MVGAAQGTAGLDELERVLEGLSGLEKYCELPCPGDVGRGGFELFRLKFQGDGVLARAEPGRAANLVAAQFAQEEERDLIFVDHIDDTER